MSEATPRQRCFEPLSELAHATGKHPRDTQHGQGIRVFLKIPRFTEKEWPWASQGGSAQAPE